MFPQDSTPTDSAETTQIVEPMHKLSAIAESIGVNPMTIRRQIDAGNLEAVRIGRHLRVRQSALEAWLAASSTSNRAN